MCDKIQQARRVGFDNQNQLKKTQKSGGQDWRVPARYEIRQLIGTGSYGHVCEALDKERNRVVAIKRINRIFEDLIDCKRILREIAILTRVESDHVIKIYDIWVPDDPARFDELYLVLELADSDFKKLFRTPVFLPTELHVKSLLYHLLLGVRYLHSAGIYHRDIKPANCLVNQDCSVKICDFGLSRAVGMDGQPHPGDRESMAVSASPGRQEVDGTENGDPNLRRLSGNGAGGHPPKRQLTGHVVTRWYRPPELILLCENYTEAVDVWSFGCITAEMLNMLKENQPSVSSRGPLFPGSSCFPLSPEHKKAGDANRLQSRGNRDQLNVIFNIIGTPDEQDVESLENEDAKRYLQCFSPRPPVNLRERFPGSSKEAVDLMQRMLTFSPAKRISVEEALRHEFFVDIHKPQNTKLHKGGPVFLPFELEPELDEARLRKYFLLEVRKFHPELQMPARLENL